MNYSLFVFSEIPQNIDSSENIAMDWMNDYFQSPISSSQFPNNNNEQEKLNNPLLSVHTEASGFLLNQTR